jgi:hypothetical protein
MKVDIHRVKLGLHPNIHFRDYQCPHSALIWKIPSHPSTVELDMSISLLLLANQLTDRGFLWPIT